MKFFYLQPVSESNSCQPSLFTGTNGARKRHADEQRRWNEQYCHEAVTYLRVNWNPERVYLFVANLVTRYASRRGGARAQLAPRREELSVPR